MAELPESHQFIVNYNVIGRSVVPNLSRIFSTPTCTWLDVVEEWFTVVKPVSSAEQFVLHINKQVIGWHYRLSDPVHVDIDNLILDVVAEHNPPGTLASHLVIGAAYRASKAQLTWPVWDTEESPTCPLNGLPIGRPLILETDMPTLQTEDNDVSNVIGLRFLDVRDVVWCNRHALLLGLQMEEQTGGAGAGSQRPEASIFLSRVAAACTGRSIDPTLVDKSFPIAFDLELHPILPILVFDTHLAWLDLRYSGALLSR
jgi:hypothetical protein